MTSFTIAICAYNAVGRIARTLNALALIHYGGPWEVLIVDNASTDDTVAFVEDWRTSLPALRVILEPVAGVAHARMLAIREARMDWIVWVDDDNILPPDYLTTAEALVRDSQDVGIVAGDSVLFELGNTPLWFMEVANCYAVGQQFSHEGNFTNGSFSWGAGSLIRRSAALQILELGFRPILTGRLGKNQLAGEDGEICIAMQLLGWTLMYSRRLVISHAIEPIRMNEVALRKTAIGFGLSSIVIEAYRSALEPPIKRWLKSHDPAFALHTIAKFTVRAFRLVYKRNMQSRVEFWISQGAVVALMEGMRPSRVLRTPFLIGVRRRLRTSPMGLDKQA
jgi:hypothetical protein